MLQLADHCLPHEQCRSRRILMVWIRSPRWDCVWVLSGSPRGLILMCLSGTIPAALLTFWIVVVLQQAHNLSPIVMAWGHDGFRKYMLRHKVKFVVTPALVIAGAVLAGYASSVLYPQFFPFRGTKIDVYGSEGWQSPLGLMLGLYF